MDLKRLEKSRSRKASIFIGSIRAANGDIKKDRLDIANAFAQFYKTLYADAGKILDTISTLGSDALDDIEDISQSDEAEQLKKMKKGKDANDEGIVAELLKFGGEEVEYEIANIFNNVMRGIEEVPQCFQISKIIILFIEKRRQDAAK